jgi:hypothetical protein
MNVELQMTNDELAQFEKDMQRFDKIQTQNNFKTTWSIYEIEDMDENSFLSADIMTDGLCDIEVELPKKELTWLELWNYADNLYNLIGDTEHLFIESFEVKQINGKREMHVFFGS